MRVVQQEVSASFAAQRLDVYLTSLFPDLSRSYLQKLIREGQVCRDQKPLKASYPVQAGDRLEIYLPDAEVLSLEPEEIPLDILYEDAHLLVINKPKGMVVHPAPGHTKHTLVHALLSHCQGQLSGINGVLRPGIVHRLDKDTTGALVACKTDQAHRNLAEQLARHEMTRAYRAILIGSLAEDDVTYTDSIGRSKTDRKKLSVVSADKGKAAITHCHVLRRLSGYTYVECVLETGRTHQIRVHLSHAGYPVLGDSVYGPKKQPISSLTGQTLHAMTLGFRHPVSGEKLLFEAPLPAYFEDLLQKL